MKTVFNKTMKLKKSQFNIIDFKNTDNVIFAISKNIEQKRFDGIYDLNNIC